MRTALFFLLACVQLASAQSLMNSKAAKRGMELSDDISGIKTIAVDVLSRNDVREELKATEVEISAIESAHQWLPETQSIIDEYRLNGGLGSISDEQCEDLKKKLRELAVVTRDKQTEVFQRTLGKERFQRFQQIFMQVILTGRGGSALMRPELGIEITPKEAKPVLIALRKTRRDNEAIDLQQKMNILYAQCRQKVGDGVTRNLLGNPFGVASFDMKPSPANPRRNEGEKAWNIEEPGASKYGRYLGLLKTDFQGSDTVMKVISTPVVSDYLGIEEGQRHSPITKDGDLGFGLPEEIRLKEQQRQKNVKDATDSLKSKLKSKHARLLQIARQGILLHSTSSEFENRDFDTDPEWPNRGKLTGILRSVEIESRKLQSIARFEQVKKLLTESVGSDRAEKLLGEPFQNSEDLMKLKDFITLPQ